MIEQSGRVVAIEDGVAWVETVRRTGCGRCDEPGGCGNGAMNRLARERIGHLRVLASLPVAVGDEVVVGVPEDAMLRGAALIYLLPLAALFAGTLAGDLLWPGDGGAMAGALAGLVAGFGFVRWRSTSKRDDSTVQPVLLRRLSIPAGCPRRD